MEVNRIGEGLSVIIFPKLMLQGIHFMPVDPDQPFMVSDLIRFACVHQYQHREQDKASAGSNGCITDCGPEIIKETGAGQKDQQSGKSEYALYFLFLPDGFLLTLNICLVEWEDC